MRYQKGNIEAKAKGFLSAALLLFALAGVLVILFVFAPGGDHVGEAKTPEPSGVLHGRWYEDVVTLFEERGFSNVEARGMEDLVLGILEKEGTVEEVSVGGDTQYEEGTWVPSATKVVIRYHSYPEHPLKQVTDRVGSVLADDPEVQDAVLTVQNCLEFADLLAAEAGNEQVLSSFAEKCRSREISFDGKVSRVESAGSGTYRLFLCAGEGGIGDLFVFPDVTGTDLGVEEPEALLDQKVHVTAKVRSVDPEEGVILLDPVELRIR